MEFKDMADLKALEAVLKALADLESVDQQRVLRWAAERIGAPAPGLHPSVGRAGDGVVRQVEASASLESFETLADALGSAHAKTDADRVLVAAAYLSRKTNQMELTGKEINDELKNLGHRVKNITDAAESLKAKKPQLMVQTRKDGTSKQARKKYKVTVAGFNHVAVMLSSPVSEGDQA